jgi:hypothetical protein
VLMSSPGVPSRSSTSWTVTFWAIGEPQLLTPWRGHFTRI